MRRTMRWYQGIDHTASLVQRLVVLLVRIRVGDDTPAGAEINVTGHGEHGADRNAAVERPRHAPVADRPAVHAALRWFELGNDLHRPHLRRAGYRAARKRSAQEIERISPGRQVTDDRRDKMMNRGVVFEPE